MSGHRQVADAKLELHLDAVRCRRVSAANRMARPPPRPSLEGHRMSHEAIDVLLRRAGVTVTDAEYQVLIQVLGMIQVQVEELRLAEAREVPPAVHHATGYGYYPTGCNQPFGSVAMWMRVSHGRVDPSKVDEAVKLGPDIAAAVKRLPGYQSYTMGGDRSTGRSVSVSTWDTEEHARFSPDALGEVVSKLRALGAQIDPPEILEVQTRG
jgi:hypothetical protein